MKRSTGQSWGILGVVIVAVALIVGAALPGKSVVGPADNQLPANWDQYLSSETALVGGKHASGGLKIAGVRLREKTYRLDLQFLAADDCPDSATGLCEGPQELSGEVMGRTMNGEVIVNTRLEVSRDCYHLIKTTDPWPSFAECTVIAGSS